MNYIEKALLVVSFLATTWSTARCEFRLQVLHTNDMHARFQETNAHSGSCHKPPCYGGFARLKTAVDQFREEARRENRSTIFLNAGDTYQGTVLFSLFKDKIVTELVNMMGFDVLSLGNHEFDNKPIGLAPFIANSSVPIVCCNIDYSKEPALASTHLKDRLMPSTVLDVDGVKIGVVGYLTPETMMIAGTGEVDIHDEIEDMKEEVSKLKAKGIKIIIALGHSGFAKDKLIAKLVPDLDLVVGGHTNTFLFNGEEPSIEEGEGAYPTVVTQPSGRLVLVVQAYAYTKYLGRLELTFNDEGEVTNSSGNPVVVDESFKKDDKVNKVVLRYEKEVSTELTKRVGSTKVLLEANKNCRIGECNFGNLAADAFVYASTMDYYDNKTWTNTPVAIINGGGLRNSITNERTGGEITYGDLITTMPFENTVQRLTMTGTTLKEALEHSVSQYVEDRKGGFLQFSGIQVTYDASRPIQRRVVSALVRCGHCLVPKYYPLDHKQVYDVLVPSYLADGGDGYSMLKAIKERKDLSFGDMLAVQNYIGEFSFVSPEVSGRITFVEPPYQMDNTASKNIVTGIPIVLLCSALIQLFY